MPMDEIEIIKQRLIEQVDPICIYLFGSFANGTAHAESDLDFYIVVNDGEKDLHAIVASAHKAIRNAPWIFWLVQKAALPSARTSLL